MKIFAFTLMLSILSASALGRTLFYAACDGYFDKPRRDIAKLLNSPSHLDISLSYGARELVMDLKHVDVLVTPLYRSGSVERCGPHSDRIKRVIREFVRKGGVVVDGWGNGTATLTGVSSMQNSPMTSMLRPTEWPDHFAFQGMNHLLNRPIGQTGYLIGDCDNCSEIKGYASLGDHMFAHTYLYESRFGSGRVYSLTSSYRMGWDLSESGSDTNSFLTRITANIICRYDRKAACVW